MSPRPASIALPAGLLPAALILALGGCGAQTGASAPGAGGSPGDASASGSGGAGGGAGSGGGAGATGSGGAAGGGGAGATGGGGSGGAGGAAGGGAGTGGAGGGPGTGTGGVGGASFFLGADITDQETAPTAAQDDLLMQMKAHGFNFIRLRTFVDPKAADGYDKTNGFDDIAHTVTFGKRIKDAGFGLLVDFHYSDNWADPGKQCIPVAWQGFTAVADLATAMHDYTKDAITQLVAGGARPDMVQIGNETTPGMLLHHCNAGGQPMTGVTIPITGAASTANWPTLGMLLKAGVAGVKEVDAGILISLHIDKGNSFATSKNWIDNAVRQGVAFDAFGESCYQRYQGDVNSIPNTVNGWTTTFAQLVAAYPNLKFFAAEYGPLEREINDVLFNLPNQQGLGTFDWEPTTSGTWNQTADGVSHALFRRSGNTYTAQPDVPLYDQMKIDYASRL